MSAECRTGIVANWVTVLALAGVTALAWSGPAQADTRGVRVDGKLPADYVAAQTGKSWAVVIGIDEYEHVRPLKYAVADAKAVAKTLRQRGFQVRELYDKQATHRNILGELGDKLVERVGESDRVLIFFSGHGETRQPKGGKEMGFLLPVGAEANALAETAIPMSVIRDLADSLPSKHVLFLVDVCYGGIAGMQFKNVLKYDEAYLREITRERGRQLITAGGPKQEALEGPEWGHSVFTYYLLEGLNKGLADLDGDGIIPASELHTYLNRRVFDAAQLKGHRQRPEMWALAAEKGEFVFFTTTRPLPSPPPHAGEGRVGDGGGVPSQDVAALKKRLEDLESKLARPEAPKPMEEARARPSQPSSLVPSRRAEIEQILQQALQAAAATTDAKEKAWALGNIGGAQAKMGDKQAAAHTFLLALQTAAGISDASQKDFALAEIAHSQALAGEFMGARQTVATILDAKEKDWALKMIVSRQAEADVAGAQQTAAAIQDAGERTSALTSIAMGQAKAGTVVSALQSTASIPGSFSVNKVQALASIAQAQAKAGEKKAAVETLEQALQIVTTISGAKEKSWALANVGEAQAKAGDTEAAAHTFLEALQTAATISNEADKDFALAEIAQAQARAGEFMRARQTAATIQVVYEKGWALGKIGLAQEKAGDRSGAASTFQQAVQMAATSGKASDKARILALIAIDWAEAEEFTAAEGKSAKTAK
jgi:tetratricopeptide (TPR) repeat protein